MPATGVLKGERPNVRFATAWLAAVDIIDYEMKAAIMLQAARVSVLEGSVRRTGRRPSENDGKVKQKACATMSPPGQHALRLPSSNILYSSSFASCHDPVWGWCSKRVDVLPPSNFHGASMCQSTHDASRPPMKCGTRSRARYRSNVGSAVDESPGSVKGL